MSNAHETPEAGEKKSPRFFVWKDGAGRWTWGYRRGSEHPPAGVRLYLSSRPEAEEVVLRLNREDAAFAADPSGGQADLFAPKEAGQ